MRRFRDKQPSESYFIEWDFSSVSDSLMIDSAAVTAVIYATGEDAVATITEVSEQSISGHSVYTKVKAGTDGIEYLLTCLAVAGSSVYEIEGLMLVSNNPATNIAGSFRSAFQEFTNDTIYTDSMINYWAALASLTLNIVRWGDFLTHGKYLFIAHHCVLSAKAAADSAVGGIPGQGGVVASKSVSDVSVSYDTNASNEEGAGSYNATTYGRELIKMARMVGIVAFV